MLGVCTSVITHYVHVQSILLFHLLFAPIYPLVGTLARCDEFCGARRFVLSDRGAEPEQNQLMEMIITFICSLVYLNYYLPTVEYVSLLPRVPKARLLLDELVWCEEKPLPLVSLILFLELSLAVGLPVKELLGTDSCPALL